MTDDTLEHRWGDDPVAALERAKETPLAAQIENDIVAGYLMILRVMTERNGELANKIISAKPAMLAQDDLVNAFAVDVVKPGTEHLLRRAARLLLEEIEEQRKGPSSLYLVNAKTGRSIMPIGPGDIVTPPDYEGLDGKMHKSRQIVKPEITSSLALCAYEAAKEESTLALYGGELAFAHLSAPEQIVERAKQKLVGIVVFDNSDVGRSVDIEFGREHVAGMEQSVNHSFHRVELFASVLAKKILDKCGGGGRVGNGFVKSCSNSKHRWYIFSGKFDAPGFQQNPSQN